MTLSDYIQQLKHHDWFYHFSDDHRVWSSGENQSKALLKIASDGSNDFKAAYNEEHARHFNTKSFVSADCPYVTPFVILND